MFTLSRRFNSEKRCAIVEKDPTKVFVHKTSRDDSRLYLFIVNILTICTPTRCYLIENIFKVNIIFNIFFHTRILSQKSSPRC